MGTNKDTQKSNEGVVITALEKYYPAGGNLTLKGKVVAVPVLIQLLRDHIGAVGTTASAKGAWKLTVVDERAKAAVLRPLLKGLRQQVLNQFGDLSQAAIDFGYVPQPHPPTAEVKAAAVVKNRATRAARGTKGKREKAKVHGAAPAAPKA
jgi:hypothetical protein